MHFTHLTVNKIIINYDVGDHDGDGDDVDDYVDDENEDDIDDGNNDNNNVDDDNDNNDVDDDDVDIANNAVFNQGFKFTETDLLQLTDTWLKMCYNTG